MNQIDDIEAVILEEERRRVSLLPEYSSPLRGVNDDKWQQFVKSMRTGRLDTVTPRFHLGLFHYGMRRLQDLGLVRNIRKERWNGKTVWTGDFIEPLSLERFLSTPSVQYKAFSIDMKRLAKMVQGKFRKYIGKVAEGRTITLSGLLALAKAAGPKGMKSWLENPEERSKYPHTTKAFSRATGIF